jgi:hypothetical protein
MKKLLVICVLALFVTIVVATEEDLLTITHHSKALGMEKTFQVYIPGDAKAGERFPVLYVLHGAYGGYSGHNGPQHGRTWRVTPHRETPGCIRVRFVAFRHP